MFDLLGSVSIKGKRFCKLQRTLTFISMKELCLQMARKHQASLLSTNTYVSHKKVDLEWEKVAERKTQVLCLECRFCFKT